MRRRTAEDMASRILGWLAGAGHWESFAAETGTDPDSFRAAMAEDDTRGWALGAVVDFVMTRDDWVRDAAFAAGIEPEDLAHVRRALPGGQPIHWT
jgi:hypothetical protein